VGRAAAVLTPRRAAFALLVAVLTAYYAARTSLPELSTWGGIAFLATFLIPAVFGLVLLVLPLAEARGLLALGLALVAFAAVLESAGLHPPADFAKLAATTALAFWFLRWFEAASWVVLVAVIVPWVDAYSVWRGPTHHIVTERPHLFSTLAFTFPLPGHDGSAQLGIPDLVFFALFLAAAARFRLRPGWTWLGLTASFGVTLALTVWLDLSGLPALPGLSVGFLLPNAHLFWRSVRSRATPA
jgi:hypothetical protein